MPFEHDMLHGEWLRYAGYRYEHQIKSFIDMYIIKYSCSVNMLINSFIFHENYCAKELRYLYTKYEFILSPCFFLIIHVAVNILTAISIGIKTTLSLSLPPPLTSLFYQGYLWLLCLSRLSLTSLSTIVFLPFWPPYEMLSDYK